MPDPPSFEFNVGLSDEEKNDLSQMIGEFQKERANVAPGDDVATLQQQIDTINDRMAKITNMMLRFDQQIKPLYETIRLTYQKSEILNHRIDKLIDAIRTGEPL